MVNKKLPEGAYAALQGLKAQAGAAMMVIPGQDKAQGKAALVDAHALMTANDAWVKKIVRALMAEGGRTTIDDADAAWLERVFNA